MAELCIINGTCITPFKIIEKGIIVIGNDRIRYVGSSDGYSIPDNAAIINAEGKFVCPGFIDLQVNGGNGSDVLDGTQAAFETIAKFNAKHGTTSLLLTLVSASIAKTTSVLNEIRNYQNGTDGAKVLGAHLEGPYISMEQRGAHNPKYIHRANPDHYRNFWDYTDVVKIITAAPEVDGVLEMAREFSERNVVMSIGHSDGTYGDVKKAIDAGFSMVTHLYCVMSTLRRTGAEKIPGILEGALTFDELNVGIIGDGFHLPEGSLKVVLKAKDRRNIFLTTDAIRAAGLPDGEYILGSFEDQHKFVVENGAAKTIDRKLYAGSTATMERSVRNLMQLGGLTMQEAVQMATMNPAICLNIESQVGSIEQGKLADIVILNSNFEVLQTIINGKTAYCAG
ncbi:N-acetylglucosamine-6-phosphate deacetylase [candidate division KSB1 bacterium]|nr:N-acetylglucosamine-6-phosphate deacetylase [candidate division KSB1 bacterium]